MPSARLARLLVGSSLTVGLVVALAAPALAHNEFVSSSPADGSTTELSPATWDVVFAKEVPLDSASGELVGPDGSITQLGPPVHGTSTSEIRFTLPADLTGAQTARWRLVSVDGHVISGRVSFGVGADITSSEVLSTSATAGATSASNPAPEILRWAFRLLGYVAVMLLGGLLVAELYIAKGIFSALRAHLVVKILAGTLVGSPLLLTLVFLGDVHGTSMLGALTHLFDVFDTTPGSMLFVRTVLGGVLAYQLLTLPDGPIAITSRRQILVASLLYAFTLAYTGHSRSRSVPVIGIPADVAHLVATSVWLGGLVILVLFVAPRVEPKDLWRSFDRYGRVARLAVITLVITGVIQTLRLHGGITTLFSQSHGRLLLLKLFVVVIMLRLGDLNRRRVSSRAKDNPNLMDKRQREVMKLATAEIASGGVVLAITAALVSASFS
ncbi:MAG: copper resistance CopC/CopD family protein [Ilumatobacteraceae bacterium]